LSNSAKFYLAWQIVLRLTVGGYWMFFSYSKWFDRTWTHDILATAAAGNNIPLYRDLLQIAAPNWAAVAFFITILEGIIGALLVVGLFTRLAAVAGTLLGLNLFLTFTFCSCPWTNDFPLVFWFYFGPLLLNVQLIFDKSSNVYGIGRFFRQGHT